MMRKKSTAGMNGRERRATTGWLRRGMRLLLWLLLLFLLLLVLAIFGLPRVALWAAASWYERQGGGYQLHVSDWTFRPWRGELALHGVLLQHPSDSLVVNQTQHYQQTQLKTVDVLFDVNALRDGQYRVVRLHINGLDVALTQQQNTMQIAGLTLPMPDTASEHGDGSIADSNAADGQNPPLALRIDDLDVGAIALHWYIDHAEREADAPALAMSGSVILDHLRLQHLDTGAFETVPLSWQFTLPAFQATQPMAFGLQQPLVWQFDGEWQGGLISPLLEGRSSLQSFELSMAGAPSLSFSRFILDDISLSLTEQRVRELSLSDVRIVDEQQTLLTLAHYHLDDIVLTQSSLSTGLHGFAGLQIHLERLADGHWLGMPVDEGSAQSPAELSAMLDDKADDAIPLAAVDETVVDDNRQEDTTDVIAVPAIEAAESSVVRMAGVTQLSTDGLIVFRDGTVQPAVEKQIRLQQLQVESLHFDGDSLQLLRPMVWHAQLTLDDYSRIEWDGTLAALEADADVSMTLVVRQLDLVSLNAYITPITGYRLQRGLLDVDLEVAVNRGMLSGELALRLRNSRFEPVDEGAIRRLSQQIAMPVETALSLLRDDDNVVRLTIPLSGSVHDPDMGFGDLTRQLSRLAVQSAAGFYLRQSLQPYSALVSLASYAGSELLAIRLQAIAFTSLSAELDVDAQAYLTKVADIMHGKPNLQLRVCPFVSREEVALLAAMTDDDAMTWQALAQQRGRIIRQFLAPLQDRDERPLFERISICVPQQGHRAEVVMGF